MELTSKHFGTRFLDRSGWTWGLGTFDTLFTHTQILQLKHYQTIRHNFLYMWVFVSLIMLRYDEFDTRYLSTTGVRQGLGTLLVMPLISFVTHWRCRQPVTVLWVHTLVIWVEVPSWSNVNTLNVLFNTYHIRHTIYVQCCTYQSQNHTTNFRF